MIDDWFIIILFLHIYWMNISWNWFHLRFEFCNLGYQLIADCCWFWLSVCVQFWSMDFNIISSATQIWNSMIVIDWISRIIIINTNSDVHSFQIEDNFALNWTKKELQLVNTTSTQASGIQKFIQAEHTMVALRWGKEHPDIAGYVLHFHTLSYQKLGKPSVSGRWAFHVCSPELLFSSYSFQKQKKNKIYENV